MVFHTELEKKLILYEWGIVLEVLAYCVSILPGKEIKPLLSFSSKKKKLWKQFWERRTEMEENTPWPKTTLQSYSNQNSMVLAQKETYGSMEQNREPRSKPTHLWSINIDKEGKNIQWREDSPFNKQYWEN